MKPLSKFAAALVLLLGNLSPSSAEVIGKSIATVNSEAIFLSDFENNWEALMDQQKRTSGDDFTPEWKKENKKLLLDQMIDEKLLLQESKRRSIKVPKRQLEEGVLQVKNRFKNLAPGARPTKEDYERDLTGPERAEFQKELQKQGITDKEFETRIEDQLRVMRLTEEEIRGKVPAPFKEPKGGVDEEEPRELSPEYEKEAKALYSEIEKRFNIKDFKPNPENDIDQMAELLRSKLGESVHARHILIKSSHTDDVKKRSSAKAKIDGIKKKLDAGADFQELAKEHSEDSSARNGGDLGFFSRGQMVPEFEQAAFSLPVGGISPVIETKFGYHILMVEERRAAKRLRFDDIKMDLAGYVYQKKSQDRYEQFVADLRKKADIKILVDLDKVGRG